MFGLAVAAIFAIAAIVLLSFGLGSDADPVRESIRSLADLAAVGSPEGQQALAGAGLGVLALLTLVVMVKRPRTGRRLVEKSPAGITEVDIKSLAWAAQRHLRSLVDAGIKVSADGSRSIVATVPTYGGHSALTPVEESAIALPAFLADAGIVIKHRVVTGDPSRSRVR